MKLKYILPVATIASVAAAVTPLAVSCGNKNTASWKTGRECKPMTPKEAHEFETQNDRTEAYVDEVSKNKFIYGDDMVYYYYTLATGEDKEYYGIRSLSVTLTDIKLSTSNKPTTYFLASFKMKMDATIKVKMLNDQVLEYSNRVAAIENLKLFLDDAKGGGIRVRLYGGLEADKDWKFDMPEIKVDLPAGGKPKVSIGDKNVVYTSEIVAEDEGLSMIFTNLIEQMFEFESNYFNLQTVVEV